MMNPQKSKLENFGSIFRFITPILIVALGYFINNKFDNWDKDIREIRVISQSHGNRLTHLEWAVFRKDNNEGDIYKTTSSIDE